MPQQRDTWQDALERMKRDDMQRLRLVMGAAAKQNPDQAAEAFTLSQKTGIPADIVSRNLDEVRAKSRQQDFDQLLADTPRLRAWLADPKNAVATHDDLTQLSTIEHLVNGVRAIGSGIYSLFPGSLGFLESVLRIPNFPVEGPAGMEIDYEDLARHPNAYVSPLTQAVEDRRRMTEAAQRTIRGEQHGAGTVARGVYSGLESVGAVVSRLPLGPEGLLLSFGVTTTGESATRARDQGISNPAVALAYASIDGAVEVATELLPVGLLFKQLRGGPFLKTLVQQLATEIPGEQAATVLQDLNAWAVLPENEEKTFRDYLNERPSAAAETLIATLVGTLGQAGVARLASRAFSGKSPEETALEGLGKAVTASKTFERMPDKVRDLVAGITQDGPVETLYAPLESFTKYFHDQNVDPREAAREILGSTEAYDQALRTGEDLPIPLADYATKIAPTEANAFFSKEMRFAPEQMNARELEEFEEALRPGAEAADIPAGNTAEGTDSADRIREDVRGQLLYTGFDQKTVDAYANLYAAAFRTMGERAGVDPFSLYEPYRLKITRPLPEILRALPNVDVALNYMLDRLRSGQTPTEAELFGPSLVEFLRDAGGVRDEGGELAALEADADRKPFQKNLIQAEGLHLDRAREMAAEAGYLPEESTTADLLDLIETEVRGQPVYSPRQSNERAISQADMLQQLATYLETLGVDLNAVSNEEIKKLLQQQAAAPEVGDALLQDAAEMEALAAEIDQAYQKGDLEGIEEKEVRLEAMLAELDARLQEEEIDDDHSEESSSIEEQFAADYAEYLRLGQPGPGYPGPFGDQKTVLENMRAVLEEAQQTGMTPGGLQENVTDEQILEAAKDAYERQQQLRAKARQAGGPGELERVREFLRKRGVDTSYFQRVSTRVPTAIKATEDPLKEQLEIGLDSMKADPDSFRKNIRAVTSYLNYRPDTKARTPDERAERFIKHAVENLLWVHDQVPKEMRERAKGWYAGARAIVDRWAEKYTQPPEAVAGVIAVLSPNTEWNTNVTLAERILDIWSKQQNFEWTDEMSVTASRLFEDPKFNIWLDRTETRALAQVERAEAKAMWIRIWDQTYNPGHYRVVTPEGTFGDFVKTAKGQESGLRWQTLTATAKAVSILENPSLENIGLRLGLLHKVRSFFNNIVEPTEAGSVTIDTHAVAAALARPLTQESIEVLHNFGAGAGSSNSSVFGTNGTYGLYAEAYRRASIERDLLPHQFQAVVWEQIRRLYPQGMRSSQPQVAPIEAIWKQYKKGEITANAARKQILKRIGQPTAPEWRSVGGSDAPRWDSTYTEELARAELPRGRAGSRAGRGGSRDTVGGSRGRRGLKRYHQPAYHEQPTLAGPLGVFSIGPGRQMSIELLEKANLSTFLHESGHFFLEVFGDVVDELRTRPGELTSDQQRVIDDYETALKFLGVSSREQIQTEHHEKFARAFEGYLREGKAPSPELRSVFARFAAWLKAIYQSLKELRVKLNPEITGVFDRMLASDEEISRAQQEARVEALFERQQIAAGLKLSPDEMRAYGDAVRRARQQRQETLQREYLEEYFRTQKDWYQARRAEVRSEVAQEVHSQRDYIALAFLRKGTLPDGSPLPNGIQGVKLDAAGLEAQYGNYKDSSVMKALRKLDVYRREGGVPADQVAELLGYSSGDELVSALVNLRDMDTLIEAETGDRMRRQYGDMLTDGTAPERAKDAVMTIGRAEVIEAEMKALAKRVRELAPGVTLGRAQERQAQAEAQAAGTRDYRAFVPKISAVRAIAERRVREMRVRSVRAGTFWAAARRASDAATKAALAGNYSEALAQKQRELLNVEMYRAARTAQADVERIAEYMRSFDERKVRERIGKAGEGYLDQIDGLRERFSFSRASLKEIDKRSKLADWIAHQKAAGLPVDERLLEDVGEIHYKDATVEQLRGLEDAVAHIAHLARLKNKLLREKAKREFEEARDAMVASIEGNAKGPRQRKLEIRLPQDRAARVVATFFAAHRKLSSFFREMDGFADGGVMWESIMRPINDAANAETTRIAEATQALAEIFDEAFKGRESELYRKTYIPAIQDSLSKMGRISVALNWGNEGNRQRLLGGGLGNSGPITEAQVATILDTLEERDWNFVKAIWKYIDSFWPEIEAKQKRVTGVGPEKVEAAPFMTRFGEMPGGYYPIVYEGRLAAKTASNLENDFIESIRKAAYVHATTRRGHTEARVDKVFQPIRLDFPGVISGHVEQVIHDLTHHEMLIDIGRLLSDRKVQDAIYGHYGDVVYENLKGGIRDIALGNAPAPDWYRPLNALRHGVVTASLGWNLVTASLQPFQISNAMARVGPMWVMKGFKRWARNAWSMESTGKWIAERSEFMAHRGRTQFRELNELRNRVGLDRGRVSGWIHDALYKLGVDREHMPVIADSYFYLIKKGQQFADIPTWLGAYEKAMADPENDEDRAVALADQAVIDAQASGHIKDLSAVERDARLKILTTFYSYQNMVLQQVYESGGRLARNPRSLRSWGRAGIDAAFLLFIPSLVALVLRGRLPDEDDEESLAEALSKQQLSDLFGMLVGVRELSGLIEGFDYRGSAGLRWASTFGNAVNQTKQGELDDAFWRSLNQTAGVLFHYPATQVQRTADGMEALWEGQTRNPGVLLFGP